jgi:hypothetical protein
VAPGQTSGGKVHEPLEKQGFSNDPVCSDFSMWEAPGAAQLRREPMTEKAHLETR